MDKPKPPEPRWVYENFTVNPNKKKTNRKYIKENIMKINEIIVYGFFYLFWVSWIVFYIIGGKVSMETKGLIYWIKVLLNHYK